ncbi:uncharacterized protein zgc:113149 isoform X4 [Dunckerocampus dactyliophorus]|uniref:uncharacterized protein zgc:113149 isoform X4 n=1 Tax=Dunckerocampus dactyliophorus TaxID=161453 RepID=UPI0024065E4F|nr:uncharacterized protein zgc:113149 isoform X4 [Dunckerocampus dactyliophorus]
MAKKRKSYCADYKLQVVKYAAENGKREAGRKFGVNEKLVRDWQKAELSLTAMKKTKKANRGLKARWPELEERVHRWVLEQRAAGRVLSTVQLRLHALVVAKEMNINDFTGGPSWCYRFMHRNRLPIRETRPEDVQAKIDSFREFVEKQKMGPKRKQSVEQKRLASRVRMRAYRARQAFKRAAAANHLFLQRLNFAASEQEDLVGGDSDWMPSRADYEVDTSVPAMSTSWNEEDDDFKVGGARGLRSKPRFSFSEVKLLLEAVRENRYILLRKFNHGVSSEAKKQKWAEITDQINNLGQNYREVRQIMKKWADLKCDGKRRLLALHAPNGSAERRRRKSSLGPVEKMVHEILLLSPKREGNSDVNLGGEDEDSKLSMEQGGNMSPSYPYPAPNSTLALPGGLSLDFSPLSSPEKEHSGDPFHSSSDFDQQEDAEPSMDFDDNDNSTSTFSYRSSFLPPTDNAQASSKPIQTYSRNQNYNATTSKAHGPPLFESDAASSPAAPLPSYSPSGANIRACTSSSSSPLAPPTTSLAANGSSQPISSYSSIPPPSNHLASSHIKHAQASDQTQPDHLPSGHKAQSRVAQLACLSVQQQRATRHLLSSVSRSLETLAQSVQLLVESQQEFVQESLLLQRETVDILKDFSNTALTMMRDKSNSGQARHPSASNI